jgi:hypothetical protein
MVPSFPSFEKLVLRKALLRLSSLPSKRFSIGHLQTLSSRHRHYIRLSVPIPLMHTGTVHK